MSAAPYLHDCEPIGGCVHLYCGLIVILYSEIGALLVWRAALAGGPECGVFVVGLVGFIDWRVAE